MIVFLISCVLFESAEIELPEQCAPNSNCFDDDGDGFSEDDGDCNDQDINISPEGTEICDGLDNDCDELVDDLDDSVDSSTGIIFYVDQDQDGFGLEEDTQYFCEQPDFY